MNKEKTKNEIYLEKYFVENGYEILDIKQYNSKTKYVVKKDDIEEKFELPFGVTNIKGWANLLNENHKMHIEINRKENNNE